MLQTCIATRVARLALRPVREGDDEALFPLFADWDVIRWLSSPPWPYTRADMQSFIREQTAPDGEDAERVSRSRWNRRRSASSACGCDLPVLCSAALVRISVTGSRNAIGAVDT